MRDLTTPKPGLYQKFRVERLFGDDKPGEQFFVLSPTHDPLARDALRTYVTRCRAVGLTQLADELEAGLNRIETGEAFYKEEA